MLYCHAIEGDDGSLDRCRNIEAFNSEPKALFLSETETDRNTLAMGKIRGTLRMRSHIVVHRATTKCFSNSFVFKNEIEKEGLPSDSPAGLGARILTPTTLSVTSNYERFQQIGESAFRSKLTPMA